MAAAATAASAGASSTSRQNLLVNPAWVTSRSSAGVRIATAGLDETTLAALCFGSA